MDIVLLMDKEGYKLAIAVMAMYYQEHILSWCHLIMGKHGMDFKLDNIQIIQIIQITIYW